MPPEPVDAATPNPYWFKDAVIYELHVRAFGDSDGDGVGDFDGLTDRLDYLAQLGVTALWLLPFYPSPLRDDGYDIADYNGINPAYGTMRSFTRFLRAAHARGLRVVTELVLNHTSDQHPWFQRSRRAAPGSRWRDFYVWSDDPGRYHEARIIFEDYETSNWTWDPVAGAYYWHRFFSHQPDLNFDNPDVREAMFRVVDRWLQLGVDGVRLDAVPYLFERDGTNCENLPETHALLRELRAHVDARFPGRMLLAEANQWPEDAVAYFGDEAVGGDEAHMAFHFPLMPRLFMAARMEDRHPIIDILTETPSAPDNGQWAIFLRNHDELTLEMVTDEERDYMYRAYATDPRMRVNLGIRRRLAPLLQNDRRKIELLNALLFSLPGTPVIYYGDEIGMGDNVYLGDRDSVRTPMQWSPDRSAGFSEANPQSLYLPVIIDPDFHYESVNVEAEERNPASLLWWMRRIIALRQQHPVFGQGDIEFLYPENAKVLAFLRRDEQEQVLVVANLSRFAQSVVLDLHDYRGFIPVELFGGTEFPVIGESSYSLTLGPHAFYWLGLDPARQEARFASHDPADLPTLHQIGDWRSLFGPRDRPLLERALEAYLLRNRWYAGRQLDLREVVVEDVVPLRDGRRRPGAYLVIMSAVYRDGEPETYVTPLSVSSGALAQAVLSDHPSAAVAWVGSDGGEPVLVHDAVVDPAFAQATLRAIRNRRSYTSESGADLQFQITPEGRALLRDQADLTPHLVVAEQSNTSVVFDNRLVLKLFRRAQQGVNPELEIGTFLTEEAHFTHTAPLVGSVEYATERGEPRTIAVANSYIVNEGDAWRTTLDAVGLYYERALTAIADEDVQLQSWPATVAQAVAGAEDPNAAFPAPAVADTIGPFLGAADLLGRRVAQLHRALATGRSDAFAPEPYTTLYQRSLFQSMRANVRPTVQRVADALGRNREVLASDAAHADGERLVNGQAQIVDAFGALTGHRLDVLRIRVHGDLHLGQVLHSGGDFVIIDFEGEPSRPPTERRIKRTGLVDVAGMIRSFQYAARGGLRAHSDRGLVPPELWDAYEAREQLWQQWVTIRFLVGYLAEAAEVAVGGVPLVPADPNDLQTLLTALVLDKALYEVRYDLAHRPDWVAIPLRGVAQILDGDR